MEATRQAVDSHLRTDDLKSDLGSRTARGGAITLVSQGLKFSLGMVSTILLARLLTPQDYGFIGMVGVFTGFIAIFKDLGLAAATIQKPDLSRDQVSTVFWVNVALSVGIMLFTMAMAPFVARFYGEPRLVGITTAYAFGFLFGGLAVQHEALLRRRMRFVALATTELVSLVVGSVIAISLAWYLRTYWALIISQLIQGFTYAAAVWIACRWRPGRPVRYAGVRTMLAFGGNLTGFSVVNYFARNLDTMMIGRIWGAEQLGLYAKAYQLLIQPMEQIISPISSVAVPALSRLIDSPLRYRDAYLRLLEKIALVTMPLTAYMIATSDWLVLLLLGSKWIGVSKIFALLGLAGLIQPVLSTAGILYVTQGRTRHMFQFGLIASPIVMVSILAGLPWGAIGVALSYSLTFIFIIAPLVFWWVGRQGPVRSGDLYRAIAPFGISSLFALLGTLVFRRWSTITNPIIGLMASLVVTIAVTLTALVLIPAGRAALLDLKSMLYLVARRQRNVSDAII